MNRISKKFIAAALTVTLILSGTMTAFGADSKGIQVQFNGAYITGSEAAKIVDGRVMVPFRQILESMGADVAYDSATKIITAKNSDREISFSAGGKDIAITENDVQSTIEMDAPSFIDKGSSRTFVPVRFLAESLGYGVSWDADEKTVVIIDPSALFTNADTDFSIISKLMKTDLDLEKAYKSDGRFDMDLTTYAQEGSLLPGMEFSMAGTFSGVQQKANADLNMTLEFEFDQMLSTLPAEEKAQIEPLLAMFKDAGMKIKMDGETGTTYMNSSIFTAIDPTVDEKTWYKMNVYETYEQMGMDIKPLLDMNYSEVKLSEMLSEAVSAMQTADISTYDKMKVTYAFLKNLIGDDAFSKKTAGSLVTYTLKLDQKSILAALAKTALTEGISKDLLDLSELKDTMDKNKIQAEITIKDKAGSLSGYTLKGSVSAEGINCTFDMTGDQKNANGSLTIDQKDVLKMVMKIESKVTETSVMPDLSLPADAVIKDYPMLPQTEIE